MTLRRQGTEDKTLTTEEIDPDSILSSVTDPRAGAIVLFLGTVRNIGEHGRVKGILYEAYPPLAKKRIAEIERGMEKKWPTIKVSIVHRVGRLRLKDISIAIAVSSPHRAEAFEACRFAIERIKEEVPVWKKEKLSNGTKVWVEGRRMRR
jgi:molybdopterin synthase catalytic subunit